MKIKILFLSFLAMIILVSSCKKDTDENTSTTVIYPNYSQLKVGNYWIYQVFKIDSSIVTVTGGLDSCFIEKDTIILGKTYFKLVSQSMMMPPELAVSFLRDSLDCIVNSQGKIMFSSTNFTSNLDSILFFAGPGDTVCNIVRKMTDKDETVIIAAGSFISCNAKETYHMYPNWSGFGNPRFRHCKYAKNVGIIVQTLPFFAGNPQLHERRLLRYHVQ